MRTFCKTSIGLNKVTACLMIKILLINSIVIFILATLMNGIKIKSFFTAIGVAVVLAIVNTILKPIIVLLTLPLTVFTLGLFIWVIDAWMVMLADKLMDGFKVDSFWWALGFSLMVSILNSFLLFIF